MRVHKDPSGLRLRGICGVCLYDVLFTNCPNQTWNQHIKHTVSIEFKKAKLDLEKRVVSCGWNNKHTGVMTKPASPKHLIPRSFTNATVSTRQLRSCLTGGGQTASAQIKKIITAGLVISILLSGISHLREWLEPRGSWIMFWQRRQICKNDSIQCCVALSRAERGGLCCDLFNQ